MSFLLDTTVMSVLMRDPARQDRHVVAWRASADEGELFTSALVVREIWDGIEGRRSDAQRAAELEQRAEQLLIAFAGRVVPVDKAGAVQWARLLKGRNKRDLDTGIAATALMRGLSVINSNVKDFTDLGVRVIDPFRSPAVVHEPRSR